jgi:hypothetical protein
MKGVVADAIKETGRIVMMEAMDEKEKETKLREERENNVIIYGIDEAEGGSKGARDEADKKFVDDLCTEINAEGIQTADIRRLGRKEAGRIRPIWIQWKEEEDKQKFMRSLKNLKDCDDKYQRIEVNHDLTPYQSNILKEARKKAKDMTAQSLSQGLLFRAVVQQTPNWEVKIVKAKAKEEQIRRISSRIEAANQMRENQTTEVRQKEVQPAPEATGDTEGTG